MLFPRKPRQILARASFSLPDFRAGEPDLVVRTRSIVGETLGLSMQALIEGGSASCGGQRDTSHEGSVSLHRNETTRDRTSLTAKHTEKHLR